MEVADFLGVHVHSVYRWMQWDQQGGPAALSAVAPSGAPSKLTPRQVQRVLGWVRRHQPQEFGFLTGHWTARRLAELIEQHLDVRFNHRYLNHWLQAHDITPQLPQRVPRERDDAAIARWIRCDWPAIKKGRRPAGRPWFSPMKPGC